MVTTKSGRTGEDRGDGFADDKVALAHALQKDLSILGEELRNEICTTSYRGNG